MSEGPSLSADDALAAIREVSGWSGALRSRTLGLTWMLWGIVAPAIFLTYAFAAVEAGPATLPLAFLWIPWTVSGILFTALLWRSAGVILKRPVLSVREMGIHVALFLAVILGSVAAIDIEGLPVYVPTAVLAAMGLAAAVLGVRSVFAREGAPGWVQVVGGLLLVLFAVGQAMAHAGLPAADGFAVTALWNAPASGLVFTVVGLVRVLRS